MIKAQAIIEKIVYITIASVDESGQPWNAPVFSAYDDNYNFYWGSHVDAQHSKNIRSNSSIFLVIYDSTIPAGEGEGVYVKVTAQELTDSKEITFAHELLRKRRPVPYWKLEQVQGDRAVRLYKAMSEKFWMNEDSHLNGDFIDIRKEVKLP